MLQTIVNILKASGVHAWEVSDVKKQGWEFYFIRHALDQHRAKNVEHITVKVYQLVDEGLPWALPPRRSPPPPRRRKPNSWCGISATARPWSKTGPIR